MEGENIQLSTAEVKPLIQNSLLRSSFSNFRNICRAVIFKLVSPLSVMENASIL